MWVLSLLYATTITAHQNLTAACTVTDCLFEGCYAADGGALFSKSNLTNTDVSHCMFKSCRADTQGGGIYIMNSARHVLSCSYFVDCAAGAAVSYRYSDSINAAYVSATRIADIGGAGGHGSTVGGVELVYRHINTSHSSCPGVGLFKVNYAQPETRNVVAYIQLVSNEGNYALAQYDKGCPGPIYFDHITLRNFSGGFVFAPMMDFPGNRFYGMNCVECTNISHIGSYGEFYDSYFDFDVAAVDTASCVFVDARSAHEPFTVFGYQCTAATSPFTQTIDYGTGFYVLSFVVFALH